LERQPHVKALENALIEVTDDECIKILFRHLRRYVEVRGVSRNPLKQNGKNT